MRMTNHLIDGLLPSRHPGDRLAIRVCGRQAQLK
jgi:hypothetical protein